jgi:hypothetical protein
MSPSLLKAIGPGPAEPHPQFEAVAEMQDFERIQLRGSADDSFARTTRVGFIMTSTSRDDAGFSTKKQFSLCETLVGNS